MPVGHQWRGCDAGLRSEYTEGQLARVQPAMTLPANEVATLAPAAGAGIGKMLAERLLREPWFFDAMVEAVRNGLTATRSVWTKEGLHTEADCKTQIQAFALVMAHMEGEPIKRVIHQHLGASDKIDPVAALRDSPQLREATRRALEKADWHEPEAKGQRKRAAIERAKVVEAESGAGPAGGF